MAAKKSANAGLPRVDFDHVIIGHLPSMIASLDPNGLTELITYEREHAHRLPFLEVMERRLEAPNNGATPSASIAVDLPKGQYRSVKHSRVTLWTWRVQGG